MAGTPERAKPKILVIGYTGGGKSTVAAILAKLTGGRAADTSNLLMLEFAEAEGMHIADLIARKAAYRERLFDFANARKAKDPAYYVRKALDDGATVVAGVRTRPELEAAWDLVDCVVGIDRGNQGVTDELRPWDSDYALYTRDNDGTDWHAVLTARCVRMLAQMAGWSNHERKP